MIQDYATLKTAVAAWLARADLTAIIPDFIQLAEVRMNADLRVRQMMTEATGTMASGLIALPSDFISPVRLSVTSGGYEYEVEPLPSAQALNDSLGSIPYGYAIEGDNARVIGTSSDLDYTLTYYAKVPPISDNPNWLIAKAPNLYLYATLLEAAPYLRHDERIQIWVGAYKAALEALQRESDDARFSPGIRIRVRGKTP